jgi:hypothetical protein
MRSGYTGQSSAKSRNDDIVREALDQYLSSAEKDALPLARKWAPSRMERSKKRRRPAVTQRRNRKNPMQDNGTGSSLGAESPQIGQELAKPLETCRFAFAANARPASCVAFPARDAISRICASVIALLAYA